MKKIDAGIVGMATTDGLEPPLPGAAPPALPGFQSLWRGGKGSGVGALRTQVGSQGDSQEKEALTCQINGL